MKRNPVSCVFPSRIQARRWTACAVVALLGLIALPGAFAFAPPVGQINVAVPLDTASPKTNANGFILTRQTISSGTTIRYTVNRATAGQTDVIFDTAITPNPGAGITGFSITAAFIGTRGLLFKVVTGNTVTTPISAVFFDLSQPSPVAQTLYARNDFVADNPNPQFFQNADGSTLFTRVLLVDKTISDTFELSVFRADTGALLCGAVPQNRQPSDTFTAEILDASAPAGSDTVRILRNSQELQRCTLPAAASLAVAPQPLAFGAIVNNTTRDLPVTFSNPGGDPVEVTALAASAHFAPLNFTGFTLQGGGSATRTIRFSPGGATATFNENLTITRNPAVGAAVVNVTGTGTPPPPVITGFVPTCGPVGTVVTVTGTGFTGVTSVSFNTTGATTFASNAAGTQITATVPAGATTGRIRVVTPGGTATSASDFAVGALPAVTITANDPTAAEPANPGQFTLSRTGSTAAALTVSLLIGGTATPGADYVALAATKTINAGSSTATIDVTSIDDTIDEADQTVVLTVAPGACYTVGAPSTATVTLTDNDPPPVLTITGGTFLETNTTSPFRVAATVTLSARSERPVSVNYATSTGTHTFIKPCVPLCFNGICTICTIQCLPAQLITSTATGGPIGSACAAGIDFIHSGGTLTFPAGTTVLTQDILVRSCGDSAVESDDTFFVGLAAPTNATISNSGCGAKDTAVATILNNDGSTGSFDLAPVVATVATRERLNYAFTWTVPEPLNWHDLESLQLRIRDGEDTVFSVLFDEASKTFSLVNEATGKPKHGFAPGSPHRLHTPEVTLYLTDTTVVASGPTSPTVTLNLSLDFTPNPGGRTYIVEVAAADDFGNNDEFTQAGTLTVVPWIGSARKPDSSQKTVSAP